MGRPPRFRIPAIEDLLKQLRYAPPERRYRQMTAAERLLGEIEPGREYPGDYVRFRITGFREERAGAGLIRGDLLIGDLGKFIERLSASPVRRIEEYAPRRPLTPEEVMARFGVGSITLHRYRSLGLVAHRVASDEGKRRTRLVYFEDAVERFARGREEALGAASRFTRIDDAARARMIRRARRYAQSLGLSLNEAAKRLAKRFGRSHEGVRRVLQQHDRDNPAQRIFFDRRPLSHRRKRIVLRALDRGIAASEIAERFGKAVSTVYRTGLEQRAQRLRSWPIAPVELPTFRLEGAEEVILAGADVSRGLPAGLHTGGELHRWIEEAAELAIRDEDRESRLAAALNFALWRARSICDAMPRFQPHAADIDEAETLLRRATRLKVRLLAGLRASALSTIEIHLGRRLAQCPAGEIEAAYRLALGVLGRSIDAFDPSRQGRLAAVATHALRTELARGPIAAAAATAARARHERGGIVLPDLPEAVYPWRTALELPDGAVEAAAALDPDDRALLAARYGWGGSPPQTHAQIATALGRPVHRAAAAEQRARRALAQLLRSRRRA